MFWATEEDKRRFIPRIVSGEDLWCQLFSEPVAGSDVAALRTRAVKHGDNWLVNGQKIWSTGAQHASWGILVARTDPAVPKHQGLTYFYVDMNSPGIECKPIKDISGGTDFARSILLMFVFPTPSDWVIWVRVGRSPFLR